MTRCPLGERKLEQLRRKTALPVVWATVRGGEDHSIRMVLEDGTAYVLRKTGEILRVLKEDGRLSKTGRWASESNPPEW